MYYHVILLYVLVILLITATVYYNYIENTPIRLSLFTEAPTDELDVPNGGFTTLYSFDNRYEKLKGKIIFYAKFKNVDKNNILQVLIADTNNKPVSKEYILSDERQAKIVLDIKTHTDFLRLQTKTSAAQGAIKLERLDIEYNF